MAQRSRVYVGNTPYTITADELKAFFANFKVMNVNIIIDRETQRPRGFAFVELDSPEAVAKAVAELDGVDLGGRTARVSEAKEREGGPGRSGGRGQGGGGRSNGGGNGGNGGSGNGGNGGGNRRGGDDDRDDHGWR